MVYTDEQIIAAINKTGGNLTKAAKALKCERKTVYNHAKNNPAIQEAIAQTREVTLDDVESALIKAAKAGEAWAVCFFLKTQGRGRGYIEKLETENSGEVTIKIVYADTGTGTEPAS